MTRSPRILVLLTLALAALCAPAQAATPASLSVDLSFAPPSGVARSDFTPGTIADLPNGTAVHGDRIYTVGQTNGGSGGQDMGIVARRADGTYDTDFDGDGRLIVKLAPGTDRDVATGIAVLPDGRLRVVGSYDKVAGTSGTPSEDLDIAIVGLDPDGSFDESFGIGGKATFGAGAGNDVSSRITLGPDGRLAVVGSASNGVRDDVFVSLREPNGSPVTEFDGDGVRLAGSAALHERGVDVAFRPGGGLVTLVRAETTPTAWSASLEAFTPTGADDHSFANGTLAVGDPDTIPGALIEHGGRYWVTGSTRVGVHTDAFLARVEGDGSGLNFRRFDFRADQTVTSEGLDLTVVPGLPSTLVVAGAITSSTDKDWGVAAFRDYDDELAGASLSTLVVPAAGNEGIVGVAAAPGGWLAVAGKLTEFSTADTSYGNSRILIDAGKQCDLALELTAPVEVVFQGSKPSALSLKVTNNGSRSCAGSVGVPAPYQLGPVATGELAPGASFTAANVPLSYAGPRRRDDLLPVTVTAPGDPDVTDNSSSVRVLFRYCDLGVRAVGGAAAVPTEGKGRLEVSLRNRGTQPCRVLRGSRTAYTIGAGKSVTDRLGAAAPKGAKVGARVKVLVRARAAEDVNPANDTATISARVVRVGDSSIRARGARGVSGTARGGKGKLSAKRLRVSGVDVAILRKRGAGCRWLASAKATFKTTKAGRKGKCDTRRWVRAAGTKRWRLRFSKALPPGRYVVFSRARIGAGFAEASFTAKDRNRVELRVR